MTDTDPMLTHRRLLFGIAYRMLDSVVDAEIAVQDTPLRRHRALAWTEALTLVADGHVPDVVFDAARRSFSEDELVALTMAVVAINGRNRLNIGFGTVAGGYQPAALSGKSTATD